MADSGAAALPVPAQLPYAELCNRRLLHAQGAYQHEWVYNNLERSSQVSPNSRSGRKDARGGPQGN